MFLQSSPLSSSVVRMEFGREVFHDGLEPLDASRLAQGEKVRCATSAFHRIGDWRSPMLTRSDVRRWKRCSFSLLSSSARELRLPARCVTSSSMWCLAAQAAVSSESCPWFCCAPQLFRLCLCGFSESCGQMARISDACQCSANQQAHLQ